MISTTSRQRACLAAASLLLGGCGDKATNQPAEPATSAEALLEVAGEVFRDVDFSPWMSLAELAQFQSQTVDGQYFAHIQGRCRQGFNEYRALVRPFPSDEYGEASVHWGLNEEAANQIEADLLRRGFKRHSLQLFRNASGDIRYQMVWLKPAATPAATPAAPPAAGTDSPAANPVPDVPAILSTPAAPPATSPEPLPAETDSPNPAPQALPVIQSPDPEDTTSPAPQPAIESPPSAAIEPATSPTPADSQKRYVVVKGDSLAKIARTHQVSIQALKEINQLKSNDLQIGQSLLIPTR